MAILLTNCFFASHKQPPPPAWLVAALDRFKHEEVYANDLFEAFMRSSAVDMNTGSQVPVPQAGAPVPPNVRFFFLPRIKCLDCPGKLYTPGPDTTASNFEVHLKNKQHKEKVEARLRAAAAGVNGNGGNTASGAAPAVAA